MVEVKSYLGSINVQSGKNFVLVDEYTGVIKDMKHIDGAIKLIIDGKTIIDQKQWDLVDQLWAYILNGIEQVLSGKKYTSSFPGSSVNLGFNPTISIDMIELTVGDESIIYDTIGLVTALLNGAEECLKELGRIINDSAYYERENHQIQALWLKLKNIKP